MCYNYSTILEITWYIGCRTALYKLRKEKITANRQHYKNSLFYKFSVTTTDLGNKFRYIQHEKKRKDYFI